jgi:hypothetical protein
MLLPITTVTHLEVCLDKVPSLRRFYCTIIVIIQLLMKIQLYICVSVVLTWQYSRKESHKLYINLDREQCWGSVTKGISNNVFFQSF